MLSLALAAACSTWNPQVFDAIKNTDPSQGRLTRAYAAKSDITIIPMKYYGGVDGNTDGVIDNSDIAAFEEWVTANVAEDYDGPAVMDYENPWWKDLRSGTITQQELDPILDIYNKGLRIAEGYRPKAQWGYFGIPTRRAAGKNWQERGVTMQRLVNQSNGLFPSVYDCSRGTDDRRRVEHHVSRALEMARGRVAVYVFVSPRYCGEEGDRTLFVPDEDFMEQADAAMRASWTDELGVTHRVAGLVLWDAYGFTPREEWNDLDALHVQYLTMLKDLVDAHRIANEPVSPVPVPNAADGEET
ncbi:MAG: hypothetical protein QGH76_02075 [Phycisphaerales bacterium]|jgi:hypothetical protein|nr:hypothetical protein [Phycisphaerales bacterium]